MESQKLILHELILGNVYVIKHPEESAQGF